MSGTTWSGGPEDPRQHGHASVPTPPRLTDDVITQPSPHGPGFEPPAPSDWPRNLPPQLTESSEITPPAPRRPDRRPLVIAVIVVVSAAVGLGIWAMLRLSPADVATSPPRTDTTVEPLDPTPTLDVPESTEPQPSADTTPPAPPPQPPPPTVTVLPEEPSSAPQPRPRPPIMPVRVGDFGTTIQPTPELGFYASDDGAVLIVAAWYGGVTAESQVPVYEGIVQHGRWFCGLSPGITEYLCLTDAHTGLVVIASHPDGATLAAWGDEFLTLWG